VEWKEVKMTEVERGGNAKSEGQQKASREERERTPKLREKGGRDTRRDAPWSVDDTVGPGGHESREARPSLPPSKLRAPSPPAPCSGALGLQYRRP
jgi:hypothetical protein